MKKVRIPFSLDEYTKGIYEVETRGDGKSKPKKARILCTDLNNVLGRSIVAAFCLIDDQEIINAFYPDGRYRNSYSGDELDLYLTKQEFENGDILADDSVIKHICIYESYYDSSSFNYHSMVSLEKNGDIHSLYLKDFCDSDSFRLATEEEKQKLFDALEKEGRFWNAEKKCIEDIKPKYTFKPKDWCLMRTASDYAWCLCQFSNMDSESYVAIGGAMHEYCIPYNDETKHILGTTEDAPEKYKTW